MGSRLTEKGPDEALNEMLEGVAPCFVCGSEPGCNIDCLCCVMLAEIERQRELLLPLRERYRSTEMDEREERDENGELTPWALAFDAIADHGCDCGVDEPGTCVACRCARALRNERSRRLGTLDAIG